VTTPSFAATLELEFATASEDSFPSRISLAAAAFVDPAAAAAAEACGALLLLT
jgi:hypothetical protein